MSTGQHFLLLESFIMVVLVSQHVDGLSPLSKLLRESSFVENNRVRYSGRADISENLKPFQTMRLKRYHGPLPRGYKIVHVPGKSLPLNAFLNGIPAQRFTGPQAEAASAHSSQYYLSPTLLPAPALSMPLIPKHAYGPIANINDAAEKKQNPQPQSNSSALHLTEFSATNFFESNSPAETSSRRPELSKPNVTDFVTPVPIDPPEEVRPASLGETNSNEMSENLRSSAVAAPNMSSPLVIDLGTISDDSSEVNNDFSILRSTPGPPSYECQLKYCFEPYLRCVSDHGCNLLFKCLGKPSQALEDCGHLFDKLETSIKAVVADLDTCQTQHSCLKATTRTISQNITSPDGLAIKMDARNLSIQQILPASSEVNLSSPSPIPRVVRTIPSCCRICEDNCALEDAEKSKENCLRGCYVSCFKKYTYHA